MRITWRGVLGALLCIVTGRGFTIETKELLWGQKLSRGLHMSGANGNAIDTGDCDAVKVHGVKMHLHKKIK